MMVAIPGERSCLMGVGCNIYLCAEALKWQLYYFATILLYYRHPRVTLVPWLFVPQLTVMIYSFTDGLFLFNNPGVFYTIVICRTRTCQ